MNQKTIKILFIVSFLLIFLIIGYLFFQYYQYKKASEQLKDLGINSESQEASEASGANFAQENNFFGKVIEINQEKIVVKDEKNKEETFVLTDDLTVEKLESTSENEAKFVQTAKSELKKDLDVWVFFETEGDNKKAKIIKIIST